MVISKPEQEREHKKTEEEPTWLQLSERAAG